MRSTLLVAITLLTLSIVVASPAVSAQSLEADLLMARIGRAIKTEDYYGAINAIDEYRKKGLPISEDVRYAEALAFARSKQYSRAEPAIKSYLEEFGRKGVYYKQALELYAEIEPLAKQQLSKQKAEQEVAAYRRKIAEATNAYEAAKRVVWRGTVEHLPSAIDEIRNLRVSTNADGAVLIQTVDLFSASKPPTYTMVDASTAQTKWTFDFATLKRIHKYDDATFSLGSIPREGFTATATMDWTSGGCKLGGLIEFDETGKLLTQPEVVVQGNIGKFLWERRAGLVDLKPRGIDCAFRPPVKLATSPAGTAMVYFKEPRTAPEIIVIKRDANQVQWVHREKLPKLGDTMVKASLPNIVLSDDGQVAVTGSVMGDERRKDGTYWNSDKSYIYALVLDPAGKVMEFRRDKFYGWLSNPWYVKGQVPIFERDGSLTMLDDTFGDLSFRTHHPGSAGQTATLASVPSQKSGLRKNGPEASAFDPRAIARLSTGGLIGCGGAFNDHESSGRKPGPAVAVLMPSVKYTNSTGFDRIRYDAKSGVATLFGSDAECVGVIPTKDGGARLVVLEGARAVANGNVPVSVSIAKIDAQGQFVPAGIAFASGKSDTGPDLDKVVESGQPVGRIIRINTEWGYAVVELGEGKGAPRSLVAKSASGEPIALRVEKQPSPRELTVSTTRLKELKVDAPVFATR